MIPAGTLAKLRLLVERTNVWKDNSNSMPVDVRADLALMFGATFTRFRHFAELGMKFLGFELTDMQADIADYMQDGPRNSMVAAQRGEAKSTLAALYVVWCMIRDQSTRALIVSGGEKQASDVAILIIRMIETWGMLCWLRPDKSRGDRTSYESYDVHCDLKPLDKSASVACVGITAQLQGKRADILIPDDIETTNNGLTATSRELLMLRSRDFAAINTHGKTLYLGTPQTKDSIYKSLERRGFEVRVWPGRVPTLEEEARYGTTLAPYVQAMMLTHQRSGFGLDGSRGEVTDPGRYTEEDLQSKELDFGPEGFQLQYMLDTYLVDAMRTRVKLSDAIVASLGSDAAPDTLYYAATPQNRLQAVPEYIHGEALYRPAGAGDIMMKYQHKIMMIDPAGNGGDEVAFAIGGALNSYIHLFGVGGLQGGLTDANCDTIIDYAEEFGILDIVMEANMGHGTASMVLMNALAKRKLQSIGVRDIYATTQKERRIIDTLSPVFRRHKFVIHERALEMDEAYCKLYTREKARLYSCFFQLQNITYDRGSLAKDDRADCVGHLVNELKGFLTVDEEKEAEKLQSKAAKEFRDNPMGYRTGTRRQVGGTASRRR
jgi:hypothetical protein